MEIPRIISVDDHVVEPPNLWQDRLAAKWRDSGPRLERRRGSIEWNGTGGSTFVESSASEAVDADVWVYDDLVWPLARGFAQVGYPDEPAPSLVTYDDIRPGCYEQAARLRDMDANHTEASLSFPTFPRFCGQTFLERGERELSLACIQAYNDWMIEDWCAGDGRGRLVPLTLVPLWDAQLAAGEVRRCAELGSHAVAFSEQPYALGLPSIHSGEWEPLFSACEDTDTVINMHIGSSSKMPMTSPDAPSDVLMTINVENCMNAFVDWLMSGVLVSHPNLRIALSEGQVGWIPFFVERMDNQWHRSGRYGDLKTKVPEPPSTYIAGRVYGCVFDDMFGLASRDVIGMSQIMFETDYPHSDSTYPHSRETAHKIVTTAGLTEHETWQLLRGNAIECYRLHRYGIDR